MRPTSLVLLVLVAGCAITAPAITPGVKLRPETRSECEAMCREIGMRLGAVVVIQNAEGCVCHPDNAASSTPGAAAVASGAVLISKAAQEAQEAQERRHREEAERRQRESNPPAPPLQSP